MKVERRLPSVERSLVEQAVVRFSKDDSISPGRLKLMIQSISLAGN